MDERWIANIVPIFTRRSIKGWGFVSSVGWIMGWICALRHLDGHQTGRQHRPG